MGTLICYNSMHELHLSEMYGHEIFLSSVLGKASLVSVSKTVIKVQDFCCLCIVCSSVMHSSFLICNNQHELHLNSAFKL